MPKKLTKLPKAGKVVRLSRPGSAKAKAHPLTTRPLTLKVEAVFEREADGRYSVSVPALAGCFSYGDNLAEARANIREAAELWLETRREMATEAARAGRVAR